MGKNKSLLGKFFDNGKKQLAFLTEQGASAGQPAGQWFGKLVGEKKLQVGSEGPVVVFRKKTVESGWL